MTQKLPRSTLLPSLVLLLTTAAPGFQADEPQVAADLPGWQWAQSVWRSARDQDGRTLETLFRDYPKRGVSQKHAAKFLETYQLHLTNRDRAVRDRETALSEATAELAEHVAAGDLSESLRSAVRVQTLSDDFDGALENEQIRHVVTWARNEIPKVEQERDWLLAQELLFRLRTLFEDTSRGDLYQRFDDELEKVNRRVALLAYYAPRRLHELRARQVERASEEPLGEYNPNNAQDWNERLTGINRQMLKIALRTAAREHIEQKGWRPLLRGGLEALAILASTPSLQETFPKLADSDRVAAWLDHIDRALEQLEETPDEELNSWTADRILNDLREVNQQTIELPDTVVYREYGDGATYELDQFTEIIWPNRLRRFRQATDGNFVGVGILIRHNDKRDIVVVNPLEGTPAYAEGVKPDDIIVQVDGESTVGWSLNDAVDRITGPRGEVVTLGLRREGVEEIIQIPIERDEIKIYSVRGWWKESLDEKGLPSWRWMIDPVSQIAYIRLSQFTEDSYNDLLDAWHEASAEGRPNGLILDLRYNPGGLLTSAVKISNLFVNQGVIVSGEDKDGKPAWPDLQARRNLAELADVPTVVLVNKGSASASEIVAGCVQAHGAAIVVGERTYGKGSVQTVHNIAGGRSAALIKLTTQYYRLPHPDGPGHKGRLVHKRPGAKVWGVDPDIVVKMTPTQIEESFKLRQKADIIPENGQGVPDPDSPDRPDIENLLTEGLDPQLETALLILQARALGETARTEQHAAVR